MSVASDRSRIAAAAWPAALVVGVLGLAAAPQLTPSISRGAEVAQNRCSACHGVALETASPSPDAPLFRVLSRLYSAQDLQRKLASISEHGHFQMPAVTLREDEIEDVSAYIAGLEPPTSLPARRRAPGTRPST